MAVARRIWLGSLPAMPAVLAAGCVVAATAPADAADAPHTALSARPASAVAQLDGAFGPWRPVAVPAPPAGQESNLTSVAASGPRSAWAVGYASDPFQGSAASLVLHFDGRSWQPVPLPDASGDAEDFVADSGPGDAWMLGGESFNGHPIPALRTWDGTAWRKFPFPNIGLDIFGVHFNQLVAAGGAAWAVGDDNGSGAILSYDGSQWTFTKKKIGDWTSLQDVAGTGPSDVWAIGYDSNGALALHFDGHTWSDLSPPPTALVSLERVAVAGPQDVWAVGRTSTATGSDALAAEHWNGT
jgi:hypothetical protein